MQKISSRRLLSVTPRRSNLVSDLYIQNIKEFKPTPLSAKDLAAAVKSFQLPSKPVVPETEVAPEAISAYEASEVETEAVSSSAAPEATEDWFVFEEAEENHH